ncbi:cilia- and flagella-associated protein 20-like [Zerene cesonia]|uniref:cilia- and flagella-associated protein 20-like n=1 Tax=Zerene cesonia TaxID=33412 RepID=UPI0018E4F91D|nr:cilia- and flagella-associated protein 20-like [Zerene cesonia]
MYRNAYQRGMLTVFFSVGSKPLAIWDTFTQDGYISRFLDQDIKSMVLEIGGSNVSTTYITCPKGNMVLGITMPFLVMIVKNLKKYFSFEVTILDETGTRRRFRVSNFQSSTQILPLCTVMPIGLSDGWNQIQFNLAEFTRRAYKKQYVEVQRLKINANIRLRRIYFAERLVPEDELPAEYKLFFPLVSKGGKGKQTAQTQGDTKKSTSQQAIKSGASSTKLETRTEEVRGSKTSVRSIKKVSSQQSRRGSKTIEVIKGPERTEEKDDADTVKVVENITEPTEATEPTPQTDPEPAVTPEAIEEQEPVETPAPEQEPQETDTIQPEGEPPVTETAPE